MNSDDLIFRNSIKKYLQKIKLNEFKFFFIKFSEKQIN